MKKVKEFQDKHQMAWDWHVNMNEKESKDAIDFLEQENKKCGEQGQLQFISRGTGNITVKHSITKEIKNITDYTSYLNEQEEKDAVIFLKQENVKCGKNGYLEYKISPSGIGSVIEVTHSITKAEKNITNYESW